MRAYKTKISCSNFVGIVFHAKRSQRKIKREYIFRFCKLYFLPKEAEDLKALLDFVGHDIRLR